MMKAEGPMGPEAALLCVRLAEYRCGRLNGDRRRDRDDSIYVAAAAYAHPEEFPAPGGQLRTLRGWARVRAALRPRRTKGRAGAALGVWAAPVGGTV